MLTWLCTKSTCFYYTISNYQHSHIMNMYNIVRIVASVQLKFNSGPPIFYFKRNFGKRPAYYKASHE